jgi:hypothetical protein
MDSLLSFQALEEQSAFLSDYQCAIEMDFWARLQRSPLTPAIEEKIEGQALCGFSNYPNYFYSKYHNVSFNSKEFFQSSHFSVHGENFAV